MVKSVVIALFCFALCITHAFGQDIVLKQRCNQQQFYLRWAPVNIEVFKKMIAAEIKIEFADVTNAFSEADFDKQKSGEITLPPLTEKLKANKNQNSSNAIKASVIQVFTNKNTDKKMLEQSFAMLLLSAAVDSSFANYIHLAYSAPFALKKAFRIKIANTNIKSNIVVVDGVYEDYPNPHDLVLKQQGKSVLLHWPVTNESKYYSAYNVLRSENQHDFIVVNKVPLFFLKSQYEKDKNAMDFIDTLVKEGKTYFYKIAAVNHFGFVSDSSSTEKIAVKYVFKPEIYFDSIYSVGNKLKIKASVRVNSIVEQSLFQKTCLQYSAKDGGNFKEVDEIKTSTVSSIQWLTSFNKTGYYRISIMSTQNDTVNSYTRYWYCYDSTPPVAPKNLKGNISKEGLVSIQWTKNNEMDLKGYLVYRTNSLNEEFVEVSKGFVYSENFKDSIDLNNLDSLIYYRIQAVDSNLNHSKMSEVLRLTKPDKIEPVKVVLKEVRVKPNGILLKWYNSSSSDLNQTQILCLENGVLRRNWKLLKGDTLQSLLDTQVVAGNYYQYKFVTIDKSGNKSEVVAPSKLFEPGYRNAIKGLKAVVNREKKQIVLTWDLPVEKVYTYHIYRLKNDGQLQLHKTIEGTANKFIDTELNINNTYGYAIKAVFTNGIGTKLTKVVKVKY